MSLLSTNNAGVSSVPLTIEHLFKHGWLFTKNLSSSNEYVPHNIQELKLPYKVKGFNPYWLSNPNIYNEIHCIYPNEHSVDNVHNMIIDFPNRFLAKFIQGVGEDDIYMELKTLGDLIEFEEIGIQYRLLNEKQTKLKKRLKTGSLSKFI